MSLSINFLSYVCTSKLHWLGVNDRCVYHESVDATSFYNEEKQLLIELFLLPFNVQPARVIREDDALDRLVCRGMSRS